MNDMNIPQNGDARFDTRRILRALVKRAWAAGLAGAVCALLILAATALFVTPRYEASVMFYVNNTSDTSFSSVSSSDLSASKTLVNSYIVILQTRETMEAVIAESGTDRTASELLDMVSGEPVDSTQVLRVTVTAPDPGEAARIAEAVARVLPDRISGIIEGTSARVVDAVSAPTAPSFPSYLKNGVLGFLLGLMLAVGVIVLREVFDIRIRTEEDIVTLCRCPVLASLPKLDDPRKLGPELDFSAAESWKLLRTKLQYSFADEGDCRVIGISSALPGEGKSLTAVNLAWSLSELRKKVLLIDCDLRRPTAAEKLGIRAKQGLSAYLTGQVRPEELIRPCGLPGHEKAFHVIPAGQLPPNPTELLSSARMAQLLASAGKIYDYILLDLPPAGGISDALAAAKNTSGILIVVRQDHCDRIALAGAVRQFEFVDAKLLGVVFNGVPETGGRYGNYYTNYRPGQTAK